MEQIITYKNLEWYVINETDKEKLLFLRDSFSNEQVLKYFTDKSMVDEVCDVKYSRVISPWYKDSYIREVLNGKFLSGLDKNDLNMMKTSLTLNGRTSITEDYVRLITKEEVELLEKTNMEVLKTKRIFSYWTMSPCYFDGTYANVFRVSFSNILGLLVDDTVNNASAVRPVISLKTESLKSMNEIEIQELIKMIYILNNSKVNMEHLKKYYSKYISLLSFTEEADIIVLNNILAKSLLNADLSSINLNDIDKFNEYKRNIIESLEKGNSKKLIVQ